MKKFEENCYGKNETMSGMSDIWSPNTKGSSTRSAYILVYEKKQKGNLKFKFNENNIQEKEKIIDQYLYKEN